MERKTVGSVDDKARRLPSINRLSRRGRNARGVELLYMQSNATHRMDHRHRKALGELYRAADVHGNHTVSSNSLGFQIAAQLHNTLI